MMRFFNFFRDAVGREVQVEIQNSAFVENELIISLNEVREEGRTSPVPVAQLKMDRKTARLLAILITSTLASGCSGLGLERMCDQAKISVEYTHISHPLAGYPFGPGTEEDAVHTAGPMGRCDMGRAYVEGGLGWKVRDAGFYGPELTGTLNVGVTLWEMK